MIPDEKLLGLILLLLYIGKHDHYTEADIEKWGCFRHGIEFVSISLNIACWFGAWYLLIVPTLLAVLE